MRKFMEHKVSPASKSDTLAAVLKRDDMDIPMQVMDMIATGKSRATEVICPTIINSPPNVKAIAVNCR